MVDSTVVDISNVLAPLVQLGSLVIGGAMSLFVGRAVEMARTRLHLDITAKQVAAMHDAADTAAGMATTLLARGALSLHDIHVANPTIRALAIQAMDAVPEASGRLGVMVPDAAAMIVGRIGKAIAADPTMPTMPATEAPAPAAAAATTPVPPAAPAVTQ